MIKSLGGAKPEVHSGAFVHEAAVVMGDVVIGEGANVWPGTVLRGDIERITIGRGSSIQDGTIIHTDPGFPTVVGDLTAVGHGCIVHGCEVGRGSLVGMGAILLTGSTVGDGCIVAAGTLLPEGKSIPDGSVAMGIPAKVVRNAEDNDRERVRHTVEAYQELVKKHSAYNRTV